MVRAEDKTPMRPREGNLPNLMIIGAQKCGTTNLHNRLSLYPRIALKDSKTDEMTHE